MNRVTTANPEDDIIEVIPKIDINDIPGLTPYPCIEPTQGNWLKPSNKTSGAPRHRRSCAARALNARAGAPRGTGLADLAMLV